MVADESRLGAEFDVTGPAAAVDEHRSDGSLERIVDIETLETEALGQLNRGLLGQRGLRVAFDEFGLLQGALHIAPAAVDRTTPGITLGQMHRLDHPLVHFDFFAVRQADHLMLVRFVATTKRAEQTAPGFRRSRPNGSRGVKRMTATALGRQHRDQQGQSQNPF